MASNITLSAGVRQNLLSLQGTADLMAKTQNRLATGKKVNSALDNPTNFFTSSALSSRAGDMSALLDNMTSGIKTLEAADNGLSSITKTVESMQSTLRQARQDKTFQTASYAAIPSTATIAGTEELSFSGGAVGDTAVDVALTTGVSAIEGGAFTAVDFTNAGANDGDISFDIAVNGGTAQTITIAYADVDTETASAGAAVTAEELAGIINTKLTAANVAATASVNDDGELVITGASTTSADADVTISNFAVANGAAGSGLANGSGTDTYTAKTVDTLVNEINNNTSLRGKIRASNDNGKLRIENLSTQELSVVGASTSGLTGGTGASNTQTITGNAVRANLASQFNVLRDQLDKFSDDASYNGINLLRGDLLKLTFNETGTSTIEIQAKDLDGNERPINTTTLGIQYVNEEDLDSDVNIDTLLADLSEAMGTLRSQSSNFGSNLSIVQNRTDFTKSMINTLQTGADGLVLADTNEEAANMLALQTRQQLSSTALSMASQADQAVLRLFG